MSIQPQARPYRLYPAYCFRASPTYNTWVKVFAADVQCLRTEPEFAGQHLYFHLNHPIRFVRVVGAIVAIEDINIRYTVLTIDDGSGATIELKIVRIPPTEEDPVDTSSTTTIQNVNVTSRLGVFEVWVDGTILDIGTVVNAKGTISEFRGVKQMDLKIIRVVATTTLEARAWSDTLAFKKDILSKPWRIRSAEHEQIKNQIKKEKKTMQDYERRKAEHDARKRQRESKLEAHLELQRRKEEVMMNAGALM